MDLTKCEIFAAEHIVQMSEEMRDYLSTGILCDGKVRELADMVDVPFQSLVIAESIIRSAAFERVLKDNQVKGE